MAKVGDYGKVTLTFFADLNDYRLGNVSLLPMTE
jgi:hypothetical protein